MKIKTCELIGPALAWAVSTIENPAWEPEGHVVNITYPDDGTGWVFRPDTDWSQGGPIIEREGINIRAIRKNGHTLDGQWLAAFDHGNTGTIVQWVKRTDWPKHYFTGSTPLVAAMRCFVASKLGDEVDVPDELI